MKYQDYLTKEGLKIFKDLVKHVESINIKEIDLLKLSMLANEFDKYSITSRKINEEGFENAHGQISPAVSAQQSALNAILKLSPVFGIDPASREKIMAFANDKPKLKTF